MASRAKRLLTDAGFPAQRRKGLAGRAAIISSLSMARAKLPPRPAPPGVTITIAARRAKPITALPVFDYKDPHKAVAQLVKYIQDTTNRNATASLLGGSWEVHKGTTNGDVTVPPSADWFTIIVVAVELLAKCMISGELNISTAATASLEFRLLRDQVPLQVSGPKDYFGATNDILPITHVVDSPALGHHTYSVQVRATTDSITIRSTTRLTVIA